MAWSPGAWMPTDTTVRLTLAPLLIFITACIDRNYQTDLWHHLARGRVIVEEGQLLDHDIFTFTVPGKQFQDVNWGSQVLFFWLWRLGGLPLLVVVNALVLAGTVGGIVALAQRESGSATLAGAVGLVVFLGLWQLILIRPQTLALALFVILYAILNQSERRPWLLLLTPLVLSAWVNVHGSFPVGVVLVGLYGLAALLESVRQLRWGFVKNARLWALFACLLASVGATLVNPYGWRVYEYVALTSGVATARKIDEWLPPGTGTLAGKVWLLSLLGLVALLALSPRRPTVKQLCLLLAFLVLACGSVRMVAWWLLILAPIAATLLAGLFPAAEEEEQPANAGAAVVIGLLLLGAILCLPWFENWNPLHQHLRSPHRLEYDLQKLVDVSAEKGLSGRVFSRFEWGEYLGWSAWPRLEVFMDGRIEIFPDEVWSDYSAVTSGHADWEKILQRHGVDLLIVDDGPYHGQLRPLVEASARWEKVASSGPATLYQKRR